MSHEGLEKREPEEAANCRNASRSDDVAGTLRQPGPPTGQSRRDFLRVAACAGMAIGSVGLGLALKDRDAGARPKKTLRIRDHRVTRPPGSKELAIAKGANAREMVTRAIEALGGMGAFVRPGETVVIKPNVGWNRLPEQAANTNPEVVAQIVRLAKAAGASKVWVTDNPVNTAERCFERSGIRQAALQAGAVVVMPDATSFRTVEVGGRLLRVADVLFPIVEADHVINVPVAKQHGLSGATIALKNWYGVIGGHRVRLHQDIHHAIVELASMVRPTLTVLDATRVLLANGPSGGSLSDVKRLDIVAASTDEVAIDAFALTLLGIREEVAAFVSLGEKAGLGRSDWKSLRIVEVSG